MVKVLRLVAGCLLLGAVGLGWAWIRVTPPVVPLGAALRDALSMAVVPDKPSQVLAGAVAALAGGRDRELRAYFAKDETVLAFRAALANAVPSGDGQALVERADDVDAGAENGHTVPVTVWVSGADAVAGLFGEAVFVPGDSGDGGVVQIGAVRLRPLTLRVSTWAQAARLVPAPGVQRAPAPFYGRFRFQAGDHRYAVDALTGALEVE